MAKPTIKVEIPTGPFQVEMTHHRMGCTGLILVTDYDRFSEYVGNWGAAYALAQRWAEENPGNRFFILQPTVSAFKRRA